MTILPSPEPARHAERWSSASAPDSARPAIAGGIPVRGRERFLVFGQPDITELEIGAVTEVLRSLWIGTGPVTAAFEREFAAFVGAKSALAVNFPSASASGSSMDAI